MFREQQLLKAIPDEIHDGVMSLDDFEPQGDIGSGGFGKVIRALHRSSGQIVAIKTVFTDEDLTSELINDYVREIRTLWKCRFPFILFLHGFTVQPPFAIITPFVSGGSLYNYTRHRKAKARLTNTQKSLIAIGVAYGMSHLHEVNVIHRDLKSMNILLDSSILPFICDFGIARTVEGKNVALTRDCGTTYWMAPEQMQSHHYDHRVDVYSYGMVLYEMLCHQMPFEGLEPIQCAVEVCRGARPTLPSSGNKKVCELIKQCWQHDPKKRPEFTQIFDTLISGKRVWDDTEPKALKAMRRLILKAKNSEKKAKAK
jgi:serine/threonine protein kinase